MRRSSSLRVTPTAASNSSRGKKQASEESAPERASHTVAACRRASRFLQAIGVELRLAWAEIARRRRRSGVALGAVAFGVVALMLFSGFIEWIFWAMREGTIRAGMGHIQVVRHGYLTKGIADPFSYLLPEKSEELAMIETLAEVQVVAPRLMFSGLISKGERTTFFQGEGVRPEKEGVLATSISCSQGSSSLVPDGQELLVGQGLADTLNVRVGDKVVLLINTPRGGVNGAEARVVGICGTMIKAYDDVFVRMPMSLAHRLVRVKGSTNWLVLLKNTETTATVANRIRGSLPETKFDVVPWTALADFYTKTVALFSKQLGFLKLIIAITVVLVILNSLTIAVAERTAEIGTAMALGASPRVILRRFLVEGLVLAAVGSAVGVFVGYLAAGMISRIGIPM